MEKINDTIIAESAEAILDRIVQGGFKKHSVAYRIVEEILTPGHQSPDGARVNAWMEMRTVRPDAGVPVVIRPVITQGSGRLRHYVDKRDEIKRVLRIAGFAFEEGNDAQHGGMNGHFLKVYQL